MATPTDFAALERDARALLNARRYEHADALLRTVLASGSGPLALWRLFAAALRAQGKIEQTRAIQEMIVAHAPGDYAARFDLAETLLLLGDYERGWREYRYRYSLPHTAAIERKIQRPRWDGRPIPGKTLLIHAEQGYGDTFQFLRMVAWAKAASGARVVLEVHEPVLPLAARMHGYDELVMRATLPPPFDMHCELMSLPMVLGVTLDRLPGPIPYLTPNAARVEQWRARLARVPRPWIALAWAGRPTHINDANRSVSLSQFAPLARDDVTFLSIQQGPAAAQAAHPPAGLPLVALSDEIRDFDDTAAILAVADLLISVDSSPVHLAGALGRPAWVMLPFVPDWRWLLAREHTPWYPQMRLFRQPARGDWASVTTALSRALDTLLRAPNSRQRRRPRPRATRVAA